MLIVTQLCENELVSSYLCLVRVSTFPRCTLSLILGHVVWDCGWTMCPSSVTINTTTCLR